VSHIQVGVAPKLRRRTYRAHGRINRTFFLTLASFTGPRRCWRLARCTQRLP
jgi:hypothetical protein